MSSLNKVSPNDCDNDQQTESNMAAHMYLLKYHLGEVPFVRSAGATNGIHNLDERL